MEPVEHFDEVFSAIAVSRVYREAVHASLTGLPEWLVPYSVTNLADLERMALELGTQPNESFVDIGCGTGGPTVWLAERTGSTAVGVDFSAAAIVAASKLAVRRRVTSRVRFVAADARATMLPDAAFDGAVSIDTLMFIDPEATARELARLVKPGGAVVLRATESRIEPFFRTMVKDYRPVLETAGFVITTYEEVADYGPRSLAFFRALFERRAALRREIGPVATLILNEVNDALAKADEPPRVRTRFIVARKVGSPPMSTQRLRLETLASHHADGMLPILRERTIYKYMPDTMPASVEKLRERYVWLARGASPDGVERWLNWIVFTRNGSTPVGFMQATVIGSDAWVGYVLRPSAWGRGYAREALRAVIGFLAGTGVRRVMASIDPENVASRRVVESLEFVRDETAESEDNAYAGGGDVVYRKLL